MAASDYVSETSEFTLALKGASTDGKRTLIVRSSDHVSIKKRTAIGSIHVDDRARHKYPTPHKIIVTIRRQLKDDASIVGVDLVVCVAISDFSGTARPAQARSALNADVTSVGVQDCDAFHPISDPDLRALAIRQ